ncbi:MAG: hypothetical protein EZS28_002334 [Streblomastix strix]|uniref:Uncharacterized protein n=1 Tax=Streblomastix strix TaxID=222440 RepID=A0A5J4X5T2_9EUKA|nr:MAG: hypothetical protein EZS28_002334 [Streblomastix strix]
MFTKGRISSRDSYQAPNCANLEPQNPLQVAAQWQSTDTKRGTDERDNCSTSALGWTFWTGNVANRFYADEPPEEQVVETRQRARAATDLVMRKKPSKHNIPPAQLTIAFDKVLTDLETKLLQLHRLLQGTLTQIVKQDWIIILKFNLYKFISIYDTIYKVNMTRALMDTTEQRNLMKTQPSPIIRPAYNNQMLRSQRALPLTDGAHPASVGTPLTRIMGFSGELDQELKKLSVQQRIDLIWSNLQIISPEFAQEIAQKLTPVTQMITFKILQNQILQQSLKPFIQLNIFYMHPPRQQTQNWKERKRKKENETVLDAKAKKTNRTAAAAVVVAVTVAVTAIASKYKKIGQAREIRQFREPMETRTGYNYIRPHHNTPHKSLSSYTQQHSPSPTQEETLATLRTISPKDPREYKQKEVEPQLPKLQQYLGLMNVIERFHEIMKPIIEEEKKKPKTMQPEQYQHYLNKDGLAFFYPTKNYRPTPIPRPKDLDHSEEQ